MGDNILVAVRVRPLIERERAERSPICWDVDGETDIYQIDPVMKKPVGGLGSHYKFDYVFGTSAKNADVYEKVVQPLVDSAVNGINATIFAYGQTSSGKTHTMMGSRSEKGVLPLVVNEIFNVIENNPDREYLLRASFMEIYQEHVTDLLTGSSKLKVIDANNEVTIKDLYEEMCSTPENVLELMKKGEKLRHTGCTNMNERSSRSHTIFRIIIESRNRCEANVGEVAIQVSHLNLVDLAGSEKANQTGATGERFREGCSINVSLSSLGIVIDQLSRNERHINFRDNKLTHILRNSLGGNARTAIICAISPASLEESHSTLRFAMRAKTIENQPTVNEVVSDKAMLKRYERKIKELQEQLQNGSLLNQSMVQTPDVSAVIEEKDRIIRLLKEKLIVSTHADSPTSGTSTDFDRSTRRKTWCPSMAKKSAAPLTFEPLKELPSFSKSSPDLCDDESPVDQLPTFKKSKKLFDSYRTSFGATEPLEDEEFDGRHFRMECLVEEDEGKESPLPTPKAPNKHSVRFPSDDTVNGQKPTSEMAVQTSFVEEMDKGKKESPKTPLNRVLMQVVGTPATELRSRIRVLSSHLKNIENCYSSLTKDYEELQEYTRLEAEVGFREEWQKEQKMRMSNELELAREEIMNLERNNDELEQAVTELQQQIAHDRERHAGSLVTLQTETIKPLQAENRDLKKQMDDIKSQVEQLEKEKVDINVQLELYQQKMEKQVNDLKASLQQAWREAESSASGEASVSYSDHKELELKYATVQSELLELQQKMEVQSNNFVTELAELTEKLSNKAAELDLQIAANETVQLELYSLRQEVESARGYLDSTVMTVQKGTKRVSASPVREDVSTVGLGLKPVQKKLKLDDKEDYATETVDADDAIDELELIKSQLVTLQESLAASEVEVVEKSKTIDDLSAQLESGKQNAFELTEQMDKLRNEYAKLRCETDDVIAALKKENQEMCNELARNAASQSDFTQISKFVDMQDYFVSQWYSKESNAEASLHGSRKAYEDVIARLKEVEATLSSANSENNILKSELECQLSQIKEKEQSLSDLEVRLATFEQERRDVQAELDKMKDKETEFLSRFDEFERKVEVLNEKLSTAEAEKQELLSKIADLEGHFKDDMVAEEALRTELEHANKKVAELEEIIQNALKSESSLKVELEDTQKRVCEYQESENVSSQLRSQQEEKLISLQKEVAQFLEQLKAANDEKEAKEHEIRTLKTKEADLQQALEMVNETLTDVESQLSAKEAEIARLNDQLKTVHDDNVGSETIQKDLVSQLTATKGELEEIKTNSTAAAEKLLQLDLEIGSLRDQLSAKQEALDSQFAATENVERKLKAAEEDNELQKAIVAKLQVVIESLSSDYEHLKKDQEKMVAMEAEKVESEAKIKAVEAEIEELRKKLSEATAKLAFEPKSAVLEPNNSPSTFLSNCVQIETPSMDLTLQASPFVPKKPVGLFVSRAIEDTSLVGLGLSGVQDDVTENTAMMEATAFTSATAAHGSELEFVKSQLLVLQEVLEKEKDRHESLIVSKNEVIVDLTNKLTSLEKSLAESQDTIVRLTSSNTEVIAMYEDKAAALQGQLDELIAQKAEAIEKIAAAQAEVQELSNCVAAQNAEEKELLDVQEKVKSLLTEKLALEQELLGSKNTVAELTERMTSYEAEVERFEVAASEHSQCDGKLDEAHKAIRVLENSVQQLKIEVEESNRVAEESQRLMEEKNTASIAQLKEREEKIDNLEEEVKKLKSNILMLEEFRGKVETLEDELKKIKEDHDTATCLIADYETEISDLKQTFQQELDVKKSQISELEGLVTKLEAEVATYSKDLALKVAELKDIQETVVLLQKEAEENRQKAEGVEQTVLAEKEAELSALNSAMDVLKQEVHQTKMALDIAQMTTADAAESLSVSQAEIQSLKNEISALRTELEMSEKVKENIVTLEEKLLEETGRAGAAERRVMELESSLDKLRNELASFKVSSEENSLLATEKSKLQEELCLKEEKILEQIVALDAANNRAKEMETTLGLKMTGLEEEKCVLINTIRELEEKVQLLQEEIKTTAEREAANVAKDEAEKYSLLAEKDKEIKLLNEQVNVLASREKELANAEEISRQHIRELNEKCISLAEQNSTVFEGLALKHKQIVSEKETEIADLRKEESSLKQQKLHLETEIVRKEAEVARLLQLEEQGRLELNTISVEHSKQIEEKTAQIEAMKSELAQTLEEKETELARLMEEKEANKAELVQIKDELQRLRSSQDLFASQEQVSDLKDKLIAKEEELSQLRLSEAEAQSVCTTTKEELCSAKKELNELTAKMSAQSEKICRLESQLRDFDQIQNLLTDSALKIQELEERLSLSASVSKDLESLRTDYEKLEAKYTSAVADLVEAKSLLDSAKENEHMLATYKEKIVALEATVKLAEEEVKGYAECKSAITLAEEEKARLAAELEQIKSEINLSQSDYARVLEQCRSLLIEKKNFETRIGEFERRQKLEAEKSIALESQCAKYKVEYLELERSSEELQNKLVIAERKLINAQPTEEVVRIREENTRLTDSCKYLSEKLDASVGEIDLLKRTLNDVKEEKGLLEKEVETLRNTVNDLQMSADSAKKQVQEDLLERLQESRSELVEANAKIAKLETEVNSMENFLKENQKKGTFGTWEEYKGIKHTLGSIGSYEVLLLEKCMRKMEKEIEGFKQQVKVLEAKVNKNADVALHYKAKTIEYRNKYYTLTGELDKLTPVDQPARPQQPLTDIREESREESRNESTTNEQSKNQPQHPEAIPARTSAPQAVPQEIPGRASAPQAEHQQIPARASATQTVPPAAVPASPVKKNEDRAQSEGERVPLANLNSPRKTRQTNQKAEKLPVESASESNGAVANLVSQIESKQGSRPAMPPPATGRVTRSSVRRKPDEEVPSNCKQQ